MYCSHCGKKVNDTMLFCPFCGEAIVIPEQDEAAQEPETADSARMEAAPEMAPAEPEAPAESEPVQEPSEPEKSAPEKPAREMGEAEAELLEWDRSRRQFDLWANPAESDQGFAPIEAEDKPEQADTDWREEIARRKEEAAPEKKAPEVRADYEPVRLDGAAPKLEADKPVREKARNGASTLVPPKQMDPNDIFMDGSDVDYDDFDAPGKKKKKERKEEEFVYEDADEGSFFMRHIRGIVGLALFVILLLMFVIFAFSKAGQQSLARINLAWNKDVYTELGAKAYEEEQYEQAALFYERALQREPDNYNYASSAVMAYEKAGNVDKETEMLKRCIEIRPDALEPYFYLYQLYGSAADRPWDITQLLQQGYERTGDTRLNVTG